MNFSIFFYTLRRVSNGSIKSNTPTFHHFMRNEFKLLNGERIIRKWHYFDKSSCCSGIVHNTILTDIRLIVRHKQHLDCVNDVTPSYLHSSIFLSTIEQIRLSHRNESTLFSMYWILCLLCWPCFIIQWMISSKSKSLELSGSFGSYWIRLHERDLFAAQMIISTAVFNNKLLTK